MKKIIGIIGPIAAGKDTAAEYIAAKKNIPIFQISTPVKEAAVARGVKPTRENLIKLGRELAAEKGHSYPADLLLSQILDIGIITGMRVPAQIEYLKKNAHFLLIAVDAPAELRFERAKMRNKLGESTTLDQFINNEFEENNSMVQRLFDCMKLADYTILNDRDINHLTKSVDIILAKTGFLLK